MTTETCTHKFCGKPVGRENVRYKWSPAHDANMPFHTACSYAHPEYDVSKGTGSPFTTISVPTL